ncbi:hypothetical protein ACXP7U_20205 [Acinetobacter baumannii]
MPGAELQRRQVELDEVAGHRAGQREVARRTARRRAEIAQVALVLVMHFRLEGLQRHRRRLRQRIQAQPGEVLPVQGRVGGQAFAPVQASDQLQALLAASVQAQLADIRALGVDPPVQAQRHRPALARQAGAAADQVTALEIAAGIELDGIQGQGFR